MKIIWSLLRYYFWNNDPWLRWLFLLVWTNAVYQCTPVANTPWSVLPAMAVVILNGVYLIRTLRGMRRHKENMKTIDEIGAQVNYWAKEMYRLKQEHEKASYIEKLLIEQQMEEVNARAIREMNKLPTP